MCAQRQLFGVLGLFAASLAACGHGTASAPRPVVAPQPETPVAETPTTPEESPDAKLAEAVERELAADPAVDAESIIVEVDEGVVVLRGWVPHLPMADAAVARAEQVHGVRAVIDQAEVRPDTRSDREVRRDAREALSLHPGLRIGAPEVRVIDGVITLRGEVGSFAERELATRITRAVRGARDVVNQLEIREAQSAADPTILDDVRHALRADRWVDEWLLDVEVDRGVVSLRGVQPTAAAKRRAVRAAWVSGVRDVDATLVEVEPELDPARRRPPPGYAYPDDREIRALIVRALRREPRLRDARITVNVREGVVVLDGSATTLDARQAAKDIAESVQGVWQVANDVRVQTPRWATDAELDHRVAKALDRAAIVHDDAITAHVHRGVVTLRGEVEAPYARTIAEEAITRIPGVRELDDRLEVPATHAEAIPDSALRQNVLAHLEAHPYVDPDEVAVTVANGEVMLRGRVSDWRAKHEALRAAHEAGATSVLDAIEVDGAPQTG